MNTMSKNQSKTCAETHELNYLYQKSDTVRGGFRGGGGGGGVVVRSFHRDSTPC